jgi:hypothetical protein
MKKLISLLLTAMMLLALVGCGARSAKTEAAAPQAMAGGGVKFESYGYVAEDMAESEMMETPMVEEGLWDNKSTSGSVAELEAKIIYTAHMEMQTLDYDTADTAISELVKSCGGYFERRSVSNRASGYRFGEYTVRVPVAEFEHFCEQIGSLCHVTYAQSFAENISEAYYDTAARLETAEIKLDRLQELLKKADNMADIITIESAISETEYTIESLTGTLRRYDALVDYSTVTVSLSEVYKLSGTETAPETFGDRMGNAFVSGLRSSVDFVEDLAVGLAGAWVGVLVFAAIVIVLVKGIRGKLKARKIKKTLPATEEETKE